MKTLDFRIALFHNKSLNCVTEVVTGASPHSPAARSFILWEFL